MIKKLIGLVLTLCVAASAAHAQTGPQRWTLMTNGSAMSFSATVPQPQKTPLPIFSTNITFDPNALENSVLDFSFDGGLIFLPPGSENMIDPAMLNSLPNPGTVAADTPTTMQFQSASIKKVDYNQFVADGTLTGNGRSRAVSIPFVVTIGKDGPAGLSLTFTGRTAFATNDFTGGKMAPVVARDITVDFQFAEAPAN